MLIQEEWKIKVPWGNLAMVRWGTLTGPPVLLIHGRQDSCVTFEPLLKHLPEQFNYVAIDMPGNGLSDPFPRGPKLCRLHFLAAMEMAVAHLGWKQFTFIGHSMGCEQGLFFNVVHPYMITKLILLDAGPTLMRMQYDAPQEIQQIYYDSYYNNYQWENFGRKVHTRKTALSAMSKLRGIAERLAVPLLERNFHAIDEGTETPDGTSTRTEPASPDSRENQTWRPSALLDHPPNTAKKPKRPEDYQNIQRSTLEGHEPVTTSTGRNVLPYVNHPLLTEVVPEPPIDLATLYDSPKRVENPWRPIPNFPKKTKPPLPRMLSPQTLEKDDLEKPGYLSWDARLKHLAPTNYGNAYYFELFKHFPPTILIRASDGAKNFDPKIKRKGEELIKNFQDYGGHFKVIDVEGNHDVHFTNPERFVRYVRAFLLDESFRKTEKVTSKL